MATRDSSRVATALSMSETLSRFASKYSLLLILLIVAGALVLRASDLRADPHVNQALGLDWSFGPYTDEALNSYSARNMFLYGQWRVDDLFPLVVYPLVNYVMLLTFRIFGMGFIQVKLLSLLASVASVFVIYLLVKEDAGHLAGLLAGFAFATSFPLTMYGRLGLAEPVQILFLLLTGLCYVRGLKRPRQMILAGLLGASTILLVKVSAAFIAPALAAAAVWELISVRRDRAAARVLVQGIGWGLLGVGIAGCIWSIVVFLPHRADYFRYVLRHSLESPGGHPENLAGYVANAFTVGFRTGLNDRIPWVAIIGFVTLPALAVRRRPALRYLGLWFTLALVMLGYMVYRPDRYELVLLPPLIAGFAVALARIIETGATIPRPTIVKAGLYALWLWILATQLALYTRGFWGILRPQSDPGLLAATLAVAAVAGVHCYLVPRVVRNGTTIRPAVARVVTALVLLLLTARLDLAHYSRWFAARTHVMVESGTDLAGVLPADAVLTGSWAPALLIGSKQRAVPMTDWANSDDPVGRFGPTHLVSAENGFDFQLFNRLYPDMMEQAKVLRRYEVLGIPLLVYELPKRDEHPPLPKPSR